MAIDRYYTPQALADATGLCISQCRNLIAQSDDSICISKNPDSRKKRWAISEKGFHKLVEDQRQQKVADRKRREEKNQLQKAQCIECAENQLRQNQHRTQKKQNPTELGFTPDGKIPNSKQLKAAGKWKGA